MAMRNDIELHAPAFALEEIEHIKPIVMKRFSISAENFNMLLRLLKSVIKFYPDGEYRDMLDRAMELSPDPEDADFFALALKLKCPLWSEDRLLKSQTAVEIYSTSELAKVFEWV
jgi:predicted nucleic acid-binding protein